MGVLFSCPFDDDDDDLDRRFESFLVRSMNSECSHTRRELQSASFNGRGSQPGKMKSFGSGKMIIEGSISFKGREMETKILLRAPSDREENMPVKSTSHTTSEIYDQVPTDRICEKTSQMLLSESDNQRFQAAVKLQKVYKSFRTRRQLADCAVLVEQRWWKLLDFAELKRSSISFFDIEKPETAISRWSRARTKAAKVGKGILKDEKARKLALQHWLEAIDPRHRYGHNLQFYYAKWLQCESKQPFFYWLDIGEGKEVNLDKCPRPKLQQQCIKYLGPTERMAYEITVKDGKFFCKLTGELLDTRGGPKGAKWIFVLSTSKTLYVGKKQKGMFQHSSFLAGGATLSAGRLVVEDGILKAVWPHSGHYLPTAENFEEFMLFLKEHNVDLSIVQKSPMDEEEESHCGQRRGFSMLSELEEQDFFQATKETDAKTASGERTNNGGNPQRSFSRFSLRLDSKITKLQIPRNDNAIEMFKQNEQQERKNEIIHTMETPTDGYETAEEVFSDDDFSVSKQNLFDETEVAYEEPVPEEKIILRIKSHKELKPYQLAQRLSCKWTTGAGPRIGCVRDYPSELQNRALEEVNLSPRSNFSTPRTYFHPSPRASTPTSLCRETIADRSPVAVEQVTLM
ncbi:hypothetical protein NMG60_11001877 [Bertholletia excelsa]